MKNALETYFGYIATSNDALTLFRAAELHIVPTVKRRLDGAERGAIRSGSVFVWEECEAKIRRWTDFISWSSSRDDGVFLNYHELCISPGVEHSRASKAELSKLVKHDGLVKRTFAATTRGGSRFHLVAYFTRDCVKELMTPTQDPGLQQVKIPTNHFFSMQSKLLVEFMNNASLAPANRAHQEDERVLPDRKLLVAMQRAFEAQAASWSAADKRRRQDTHSEKSIKFAKYSTSSNVEIGKECRLPSASTLLEWLKDVDDKANTLRPRVSKYKEEDKKLLARFNVKEVIAPIHY